ncbi:MAG: amidohydrolase family protein [Anaerolineae bacterium]|nr:amidohydrolase family protein [Anaerolineae bacterium]
MIIDADCHISSAKFDGLAITADELVAQMDRAGVDKALIWLKPPYNKDIAPENKAVYEATQKYPDRLLGFGWTNPRLGKDAALATIAQCFEEYGFWGIKFNGAQDDYVIDDATVMPLIKAATRYGKPIAFHIGSDFFENTHPYRLGHIAATFPETRFIMIHMGGARLPALDRAAIETAQKYDNIIIIGSSIPATAILRAIDTLGSDRICFGSDIPFRLMHVELAKYRALMRDLAEVDQTKILGGNLAHLLSLK